VQGKNTLNPFLRFPIYYIHRDRSLKNMLYERGRLIKGERWYPEFASSTSPFIPLERGKD